MEITNVEIKVVKGAKLLGFASVTFDRAFKVTEMKILLRDNGSRGIVMPQRKTEGYCPGCRTKNPLSAKFCNECAAPLPPPTPDTRLFADIAHPITQDFRRTLDKAIFEEYDRVTGEQQAK